MGALQAGKKSRLNWLEKDRTVDVFDAKRDVIQSIIEAGFNKDKLFIRTANSNTQYVTKLLGDSP